MAFLAVNGPFWDGTEESWAAFQEWLRYEAGQQSVLRSTTELLDYLETLPPHTRITTFAEYSVVIQSASPAAEVESTLDESAARIRLIPGVEKLSDAEIADLIGEALAKK